MDVNDQSDNYKYINLNYLTDQSYFLLIVSLTSYVLKYLLLITNKYFLFRNFYKLLEILNIRFIYYN